MYLKELGWKDMIHQVNLKRHSLLLKSLKVMIKNSDTFFVGVPQFEIIGRPGTLLSLLCSLGIFKRIGLERYDTSSKFEKKIKKTIIVYFSFVAFSQ